MNEKRTLAGYRILNTRAVHQATTLTKKIEQIGGTSIEIPLIEIKRSQPNISLKSVIQDFSSDDWIVFTSKNGISFFFEHLSEEKLRIDYLSHVNIAVVGEKTKKTAEKYQLNVKACPSNYTAESLKDELIEKVKKDSKILIVRGNLARPTLREGLKEIGFSIIDFIAYETKHIIHNEDLLQKLIRNKQLDFITFTSSSTVESFISFINNYNLNEFLKDFVFVSIGSVTAKTLSSYGLKPVLTPDKFTIDGMIDVMCAFVMNEKGRNYT